MRPTTQEPDIMGRVVTEATIENIGDLWNVQLGKLASDQVRRFAVSDALVDTSASLLSLPTRFIRQLGLMKTGTKHVTCSAGMTEADIYAAVRLTIQGRNCTTDVLEVPDNVPILIGQLPLENLDLIVNLREHKLTGNPAHGGEHIFELY